MNFSVLSTFSEILNQLSGGNEFIKGALSLWILGVVTFLCKNIPAQVFNIIKHYCITELTFNNCSGEQEMVMTSFHKWLKPYINENMSRTLSITSTWHVGSAILGIGYGTHLFFFNKRLFWINKKKLESSGSERQKDEIILSTIGRSHKPFIKICKEFIPKKSENEINLFHLNLNGEWETYQNPPKRNLDTIALSPKLKENIQTQINHFLANKSWFYKSGLPYKLTYLLYGEPGGGKTSLIKAIASEYNMNICVINITSLSDNIFERACATIPKNSVLIIEDFDSNSIVSRREKNSLKNNNVNIMSDFQMLSLTGILNVLDGINPLDSCIIFLTTNYLENIDKAIYRKGRVDYLIEITKISGDDIKSYCKRIFPNYTKFDDFTFNSAMGCKLNEALLYGKNDPEMFLKSLEQNKIVQFVNKEELAVI